MRCALSITVIMLSLLLSRSAYGQCESPPNQCTIQTPLECDCAGTEYEFTICHGGTDYTATVWMCTQHATAPIPIDNPCTIPPLECDYAVNSVTWIKKICVPQALKNLGIESIYQAIIRGTDLCCFNFLGVTIPKCNTGTTCATLTNSSIYCHILALPKCLYKDHITGCYTACDNGANCSHHCFVERRYCRQTPTSCCSYLRTICEGANEVQCSGSCNVTFDNCCNLGGGQCCTQ